MNNTELINKNIISFSKIISLVEKIIKKYTKLNNINYNNELYKEIMNKYKLTNKSVDIIIVYNIRKNRKSLFSDMNYFNVIFPYLEHYKKDIENKIYIINSKIIEFINKKNDVEINKLSKYNYDFHLLYNNIEKCMKYIDKIQKYFLEEYFISNKNIV